MKSQGNTGYTPPLSGNTPAAHASSHAVGGSDPLSPAMIGALAAAEVSDTPVAGKVVRAGVSGTIADGWLSSAIARISQLTWENITGKPTLFPPSAHTHSINQVTGLSSALDGLSDAIAAEVAARIAADATKADLDAGKHRLSEIPGFTSLTVGAGNSVDFVSGAKYVLSVLDDGTGDEVLVNLPSEDQAIVEVYVSYLERDAYVSVFGLYLEAGQIYTFFYTPDAGWVVTNRPYSIPVNTPVDRGGTGATNATGARSNLGLANNYSVANITAAGNTTVSAWSNARRGSRRLTVSAGSGAYTHTVTLATSSAIADDRAELDILMPASANPTVQIRNATSGGTLLVVVPVDSAVARTWRVVCQYNGSAWQLTQLAPLNAEERLRAYVDPRIADTLASKALVHEGSGITLLAGGGIAAPGTGDFYAIAWVDSLNSSNLTNLFGGAVGAFTIYTLHPVVQVGVEGVAAIFSTAVDFPVDGRFHSVEIWRENGVITLSLDGTVIGGPAPYAASINTAVSSLQGYAGGSGPSRVARARWFNCVPTTDERAALRQSLGVVPRGLRGGSMTPVHASDFSAGADNWSNNSGADLTFTGNIDSIGGRNDTLRITAGSGAAQTFQIRRGETLPAQRPYFYRVTLSIFPESGSGVLFIGGGAFAAKSTVGNNVALTNNQWNDVTFVVYQSPNWGATLNLALFADATGGYNLSILPAGKSVYFRDIKYTALGTLYEQADADQGAGPVLPAAFGPHTLLPGDGHNTGGVLRGSWRDGETDIGPFDIAGSGNAIAGGVDVQRMPDGYSIVGAAVLATTGSTGNVGVGTDAGTSNIVGSTAITANTRQSLTVGNPAGFTPSRIWVNRTGTMAAGSLLWLRIAPAR